MTIDIVSNADGGFDVIRSEPKVLGSFANRDLADLFLSALKGQKPLVANTQDKAVPAPKQPATPPAASPAAPTRSNPVIVSPPSPAPLPTALVSDAEWNTALDRLEAGENCKAVSEDMSIPFGSLRSKWAGSINSGARKKPEPQSLQKTSPVRESADSPTSGGVGAVLARGQTSGSWSDEDDIALLACDEVGLLEFARDHGRLIADCDQRLKTLRDATSRLMTDR